MFLTKDDFNTVIASDKLAKIIDDNDNLLNEAILVAVDEMSSYLSGRYDVSQVFAATGDIRNHALVMKCTDVALYHLYSRITPNNIPDIRRDRNDQVIEWLKMINKGNVHLNLPLKPIGNQIGYVLYGGNPTFSFR